MSQNNVTPNYRHVAHKSFKELNKQGYNFPSEHGDNTSTSMLVKEGEAEAQTERERKTYPRLSSELAAELETKPVNMMFTYKPTT